MAKREFRFAALVLAAGLSVAGCSAGAADSGSGVGEDPASVTAIGDAGELHRIELSADAASRIGLTTDTVRVLPAKRAGSTARLLGVSLAAVLYDQDGVTWVYAQTAPLTFQREQVTVSGVSGDLAILTSGPAPGTSVATMGAAELRGSEDGVPGE